jgi:hypothetical protein
MKRGKVTFIFMLVVSMFFWVGSQALQGQQVKIKLDESTYGISADKLKQVSNTIIQERLGALKSKSWRVQAHLKSRGENFKKNSLDYELTVLFLHKNTYTAEVKKIKFSLINGKTKEVTVRSAPLVKLRPVKKIPIRLSCRMKQGLIIKPVGTIQLQKKMKPLKLKKMQVKRALPKAELKQSIARLQKLEISPINWWYAKGLATTPCDNIPTAVSGTQDVFRTFIQAFGNGNASMRIGNTCTTGTVTSFLKYDSKLLTWNHIGHGWPGGIVLWDTSLQAAAIQNLDPSRGIYCAVALINSCNTFNDPLKAAFLANNPRTYIAGAISLPIGPSEKVDMCFWKEVLLNKKRMDASLAQCSKQFNLSGAFGLAGDAGLFWY